MRYAWMTAVLLGCSSTADLPPPELALYVGHELDNWSVSPEAKRLKIDMVQADDGSRSVLLDAAAPPPSALKDTTPPTILTLPEQHFTGRVIASFQAAATDASDQVVVRGATVPFLLGALQAVRIPLFLGRVGQFSRPPDTLEHLHLHPVVVSLGHEYVIAAGGDAVVGSDGATPDIYDQAIWRTLRSQPPLPRAPKSMAIVVVVPTPTSDPMAELFVADDGGATWLNLSTDGTSPIPAPTGLDFSEIDGGDALTLPDGTVYVVGATRAAGMPTDKVLRIDAKAELRVLTLGTPRVGAGASVVGTTLVVAGGSGAGPMAEVLSASQTSFTPLTYPADATTGLGVAALDAMTAVAAGGKDPTTGASAAVRTFDTTCAVDCTTSDVATLPLVLDRTRVFVIDGNRMLVVGESEDGQDHAFLVDTAGPQPSVDEKALREPRKGATPTLMPNGHVGLIGGQLVETGAPALTIEAFIP
jgi:hypothetical protein